MALPWENAPIVDQDGPSGYQPPQQAMGRGAPAAPPPAAPAGAETAAPWAQDAAAPDDSGEIVAADK